MNKVVVRYVDGRVVKGVTADFFPGKDSFHVSEPDDPAGSKPKEIQTKNLKALFFVKDYAGNKEHVERNEFDPSRPAPGRRIKVVFKDGEVLLGTTTGYQRGRPGFFIIPADPGSNIERCYVVTAATKEITFV
jgi:hypothetical protein